MSDSIIIGMDVHKKTIQYCILKNMDRKPISEGSLVNEEVKVRNKFKSWKKKYPNAKVVYEAGGCGYRLYEWAHARELDCRIIAPSTLRRKTLHKKTDRLDALDLAKAYRNQDVNEIKVPDPEMQGLRRFMKLRHSVSKRNAVCKVKIQHFLNYWCLRVERPTAADWPERVLSISKSLPDMAQTEILFLLRELEEKKVMLSDIDKEIELYSQRETIKPYHDALVAMRGVGTSTAMTLISCIVDIRRFKAPIDLMNYLGLVPRPWESGGSRKTKGVTKSCSKAVMTVITQAAQNQTKRYSTTSKTLRTKREGLDIEYIKIADKAGHRLNRKFRSMEARNKPRNCSIIAVGRELLGFVWSMMMKVTEQEFTKTV